MTRTEPYIGMPINLADCGKKPETGPCCDVELKPQTEVPMQTMVVGMAYVPWQKWEQPYGYDQGFDTGTVFPALNYPFEGYQGGRRR